MEFCDHQLKTKKLPVVQQGHAIYNIKYYMTRPILNDSFVDQLQQLHNHIFQDTTNSTTHFTMKQFQLLPSTHLLTRLISKTTQSL
jgi:hypothetical protein